ncbi:MAG: hypothetical protein ACI8S6_005948 [Myxococcota bacterium]|jgi:hypothetical protein
MMASMIILSTAAWAAPAVIVAGGVGLPNLVHGHVEVSVAEAWSVELGGGGGLLPWSVTAGARWRPERTTWGLGGGHGLRLSPGVTAFVFPQVPGEGLVTINADLAWLWQGERGWGMIAGARLGGGIAYGEGGEGLKIEPGIEVVPLQLGVVR